MRRGSAAERLDPFYWQPKFQQVELALRSRIELCRPLSGIATGLTNGDHGGVHYTATGVAYQFGLEWGAVRSRSFRFVVIDEAFGRGSDESAQYGLRLFQHHT